MKTITRTITTCKIEGEKVFYNEKKEFIHEPLQSVITTDSEDKVRKNPEKYFPLLKENEVLVISSITTTEKLYSIPLEKFIELSESLEVKAEVVKIVEELEKEENK